MEKIGEILEDGTVVRGESMDGYIYKDYQAFFDKNGICYIPEKTGDNINEEDISTYTYDNLLDMCRGNKDLAERLFHNLTWEHPDGCLEQLDGVVECQGCGYMYDVEESDVCPKCEREN